MKRTALILIVLVLVSGIGAVAFLKIAARGFSAREEPSAVEKFLARAARSLAVPNDVKVRQNPEPDIPEVLAEARAHWADHCASCHANNGSGDTEMGRNLYPRAPDMRQPATQDLTDGELFFIIENGVRLTGMPAWGAPGRQEESWKLVRFIRHLPRLSAEEEQQMLKMNPKSPAELEEEKAEEEFLRGENPHVHEHSHH